MSVPPGAPPGVPAGVPPGSSSRAPALASAGDEDRAARAWPAGAATGIGSLPGTDFAEALRLVLGELPLLPHLPELPGRGVGAELTGRTAAVLVDLPVDVQPSGWRLTGRPGRDLRRARDLLERDLDTVEQLAGEVAGAFKVQLAGPWTLAASIELHTGHRVVSDPGAVRDLAASLVEGLRGQLADVARRVPSASLVVQLDEPALPAVIAGRVPTPSGYGSVRAVEAGVVEQTLRDVLSVAPVGGRVVHCCTADPPVRLFRDAGADAVSLDLALIGDLDPLGEAVEDGCGLWLGVVPGTDAAISLDTAREPLRRFWATLGFPDAALAGSVVPTPACGLAGASPSYVRRALSVLRDTGRALLELA